MNITPTTGRKALALGLGAGLALALTACGGYGGDDDDPASGTYGDGSEQTTASTTATPNGENPEAGATLQITAMQYDDVSGQAGGTLVVENRSDAPHTFTSDDGAWQDVEIAAGGSATIQLPSEPGDYPFHCEIHPSMAATLTVA